MSIENLRFGSISSLLQSCQSDLDNLEKLFAGAVDGRKSGHGCGGKGDHGGRGDKCTSGTGDLAGLLGEIKDELAQLEDRLSGLGKNHRRAGGNCGGYGQGGWSQGGWNQGGYGQGGFGHGGYGQGGYGQGGWNQGGWNHGGNGGAGQGGWCLPPVWSPPVNCGPDHRPDHRPRPPVGWTPPKPPVDCHPKPLPMPPGCGDGHGKKDDLLSFANNGKTGTVKVGDRYELSFDQSCQSVTLKDLCDKSVTKVWGDPHVSESNGDKWEFKKDLTFKLEDGTRVTFHTVGGDGKPVTGDTKGPSFVDKVDIVKGHDAATVENIAGQFHHGEGLKMKELDKAPMQDKNTPVIVEKGSDYFLNGKEVNGDTFNKNGETPRA
ncbi:MAG: DUF1521 domain-containing protein [Alsobacter sp.]